MFVATDDEITAGTQMAIEPQYNLSLQFRLEIGKDEIAAEGQVEGSLGHFGSNVLQYEAYILPEFRAEAEAVVLANEGLVDCAWGHVLQRALAIASPPGAAQHHRLRIGGDNLDPGSGMGLLGLLRPSNAQAIGLLARGAASTPAAHATIAANNCLLRQVWQDAAGERVEDPSIAIEARDRDAAKRFKLGPLLRIPLEQGGVILEAFETEFAQAPAEPLANGAPYLSVARPA